MRTLFPAFLDLSGRRVLLVGGGAVAAAKLGPLLEAGALVTVVAPKVAPSIHRSAARVHLRPFVPSDLDGCWYAVAAAPRQVNALVQREAEARRVFVNAVDDPRHATAFAGSVVRRGPVSVAISTGGQAPALARLMREALERLLPEALAQWTAVAHRLRAEWRRDGLPMARRRDDLLGALVRLHEGERPDSAAEFEPQARGSVAIVGAGPGDPGLLTRRAAACLAHADVVFYDALVPPCILALAPHATLVPVGRRCGAETMSQMDVHRQLVAAARRGERVVRLKAGDPFVFGRGGEDLLALVRQGVVAEVVPGVSSAFAGPALAGIPVTHRGKSSGVLVVTGHDVDRFRRLTQSLAGADLTLVVLMSMHGASALGQRLRDSGWNDTTPAAIVRGASRPEGTVWTGTLKELALEKRSVTSNDETPGLLVIGEVVGVRDAIAAVRAAASPSDLPAAAGVEVCHG